MSISLESKTQAYSGHTELGLTRSLSGVFDKLSSPASPSSPQSQQDESQYDRFHRKTKITCTLGPSTNTVETIAELLKSGMNCARLNFSHGSHESHLQVLNNVRAAMKVAGRTCAFMLDTKGPEIRTGLLINGKPIILKAGQELAIHCREDMEKFIGTEEKICLDYVNLPNIVSPGAIIKIDDGLIVCKVLSVDPTNAIVKVSVANTAELGQRKGVNLPGAKVDLPVVTARDKKDLKFAVENKMDIIAASFTRNAECVREIRGLLGEEGKGIKIICKIENQEGMDNFDEILAECDGIMVARGDLGVEIPIQKVCMAQKMMIRKCNLAAKPVITATQMLESMVSAPRPTRAEATDVANAVFDGSDCVMLSGETAKGEYPFVACSTMARICRCAEAAMDYISAYQTMSVYSRPPLSRSEVVCAAAVKVALELDVGCIIIFSETGGSARFIAKYKPKMPVLTLTFSDQIARQLKLTRGVWPLCVERASDDVLMEKAVEFAKFRGWLPQGKGEGQIVFIRGAGVKGSTNTMKVLDV